LDQTKLPQQQNGFTAHQEISSQAQLGSSTESKVITETTRTTSATVRLEHKSNFNDLPPVTVSQRTQTPTIPLVSEGTMVDREFSKKEQSAEATQTQTKDISFPFAHQEPQLPQMQAPEPIRKSAIDFFENNLKNLPPLSEDKYTRFEDAMKGMTYVHKQQEIKEQFTNKLNDDLSYFNLKPEPPPEMSFMPKTPQAAPPEKIVERVKKLEEMHQASETPLSGTVYPQGFRKEEKFEKKEFISTKSTSPFPQKPISPAPSYLPQVNRDQLKPEPMTGRSASPKPSMEGVNMEKLWALKPKSPEPFSQHYSQQQTFSHEHKSSFVAYSTQKVQQHEFMQPIEPPKEQFVPIQPYQTPAQPQQQEEMPKTSIRDTKSFFEQRIKEEEVKAAPIADLKAPGLVKQFAKPMVPLIPDNYDLGIEPGEAPEICYAPKPVLERKQSYVEKIEKSLEQNIEKEPDRVPRGGVRLLPSRQTPQRHLSQSPQRYQQSQQFIHSEQHMSQQFIQPEPKIITPEPIQQAPIMRDVPIQPAPVMRDVPIVQTQPAFVAAPGSFSPQQQSTFESKEFRSETMTTSESNMQGYRHVEPPKFAQRGKSSEPGFVPPPSFAQPFVPPATKAQSVTREVPITVQKPAQAFQSKPFQPQPAPAPVQQQPVYQAPPPQPQPLYQSPQPIYQQPIYQAPPPVQQTSPKQIIKPSTVKSQNFGEFVTETRESRHSSLYRNFVKSEQTLDNSSESYFQRVASPKTIQPPSKPQQQQQQQQPPQFYKKPDTQQSQVRKKFYPDVML
jgi:hypothetical protein